ncbi:GGDEF domain-containing protein [Paenibacillus sinopodophylli]|uniref:GGDEF domain-containing protein n=1 Tax=Paenibacillus sinopodophylli TaxID=1837342 RepID=UPI001486D0D8|nr:GGDEF domain-containing protein [Paenibacillus sinopodophylli]
MVRKLLIAPDHLSNWNNIMRLSYWAMSLLSLAAVFMTWLLILSDKPYASPAFFEKQVLIRNSLILGTLIVAELIYRLKSSLQDYIIIMLGSCFGAITLALSSTEVRGVQIVMVLPILVSILHFNYGKVIFACWVTMVTYLFIMFVVPAYRYEFALSQKAIGFSVIIIVTLISLGIVNRGLQMMKEEKEALRNEKKHRLQQQAVHEAASMDALTSLENHKTFQERMRLTLADESQSQVHLAILDIDNFKLVNDTYGHAVGDQVLRKVGKLLRTCSKENIFPSRYGGEEFTIIFVGLDDKAVAECLEHIRLETERLSFGEMEDRNVTISIGCHKLQAGETRDVLFRLADEALYTAKRCGKNRIAW